jgi:DNA polymerase III epsilon subunit-like protein
MNLIFFDTETTGVPVDYSASPIKYPDLWPRAIQVAWILSDEKGQILEEKCYIIFPDDFKIPKEASRINSITTDRAKNEGFPLLFVLELFSKAVESSDLMIGHNVNFDRNVMAAEFVKRGLDPVFYTMDCFCTMSSTTTICRISGGRKGKYKWPSLMELYQFLFKTGFNDAHDALSDVRACMKCYFELKRLGFLPKKI